MEATTKITIAPKPFPPTKPGEWPNAYIVDEDHASKILQAYGPDNDLNEPLPTRTCSEGEACESCQ